MWKNIRHCGLMVCCLISPMIGMTEAQGSFAKVYQAPQGFHWYQPTQTSPVMTTNQPAIVIHDPVKEMAALRARVQTALDRAILYPSVENATRYLALNNLLMNNASHFSITVQQALLLHPDMSYAIEHPTQNAARKILLKDREVSAVAAVKQLAKKNGCVFFYRGNQPLDQLMAKTLATFSQHYGINIIGISVDHKILPLFPHNRMDNGQASYLHVNTYPALLLVNPKTKQVQPVVYGVLSASELLHRFWFISTHFNVASG